MYKQLSESHLSAALAYSKLVEVEQIALNNKQVAEQAQAELEEANKQLSLSNEEVTNINSKLLKYESVIMQGRTEDYINIKSYLDNKVIEGDDELDLYEGLNYQEVLSKLVDDIIELRIRLKE